MPTRIAALDLGTHAIKLVEIEVGREVQVVTFDREPLPAHKPAYIGKQEGPSGADGEQEAAGETGESDAGEQPTGGEESSSESGTDSTDETTDTSPGADGAPDQQIGDSIGAAWQQALAALLERHEFSDDTLFSTFLPEGRAISIHEDVPLSNRNKVKGILPHRLEDRLPQEPEDLIFDFNLIEQKEEGENTALIGLGLRDDVGRFLDDLGEQGLDPAIVGIPEIMLRYALEGAIDEGTSTAAVIDLGHRFTRVLVLDEGKAVMARSIKMGGRRITNAIARKYDVTTEQAENYKKERGQIVSPTAPSVDADVRAFSDTITDALKPLVRDLRNSFQSLYARDDVRLEQIYITGGTSQIVGLSEHLHSEFQVPVDSLPIGQMIDAHRLEKDDRPLATLGLSHTLQQVYDKNDDHLLNLRQDEFAYKGSVAELRNRVLKYAGAAIGVLVMIAGLMYSHLLMLESRASAMRDAVASQTEEVFGEPAYSAGDIRERARTGGGATGRPFIPKMSAFELMYKMFDAISEDIELQVETLDIDTDRNVIQMEGKTSGPAVVDQIVSDIQAIDCLTNVKANEVQVRNENTAEFTLEIKDQCSG